MPLQLLINGKSETLADLTAGATLTDAVAALALKSDRVAIERNGEIAPRTTWPQLQLNPGDRLEIVHFVGGGTGKQSSSSCLAKLEPCDRSRRD